MRKKIFLAEYGILDFAAKQEGLETYHISDIKNMDFKEFSNLHNKTANEHKFGMFYVDEKNYLISWKKTIDELEQNR